MIYPYFKKATFILTLVTFIGTLSVHLFDAEFSGKFTQEDISKLVSQGKKLYISRDCINCHGKNGNAPESDQYPKIAGQSVGYIKQQIMDIRDGTRSNSGSGLMRSSVEGVTDEEAYLIALYLQAE